MVRGEEGRERGGVNIVEPLTVDTFEIWTHL